MAYIEPACRFGTSFFDFFEFRRESVQNRFESPLSEPQKFNNFRPYGSWFLVYAQNWNFGLAVLVLSHSMTNTTKPQACKYYATSFLLRTSSWNLTSFMHCWKCQKYMFAQAITFLWVALAAMATDFSADGMHMGHKYSTKVIVTRSLRCFFRQKVYRRGFHGVGTLSFRWYQSGTSERNCQCVLQRSGKAKENLKRETKAKRQGKGLIPVNVK